MNFREKLVVQIVICMMIFACVKSVGMLDIKGIREFRTMAGEQLSKNYTAEDIKEAGSRLLEEAKGVGTVITGAVVKANSLGEFGEPIDLSGDESVKMVYAVAAGEVTEAGISEDIGMFVKIRHESKESLYGNLCELSVVTGEKVRKGALIGSFDSSGEKEFIFSLDDLEKVKEKDEISEKGEQNS